MKKPNEGNTGNHMNKEQAAQAANRQSAPNARSTAEGEQSTTQQEQGSFSDIEPVVEESSVASCWTRLLETINPDKEIEPVQPWSTGVWFEK